MTPLSYQLFQVLGFYLTFGITAAASFVALRRTTLQGFRLIYYFALTRMILSFLSYVAVVLVSHYISIEAAQNVMTGQLLLCCPIYAVGLAGLFSLLRTRQVSHAA
jgi:hypothetical protein